MVLIQAVVQRRTKSLARLDALLELLGPKWLETFRADLANKTPLRFLAAGYACPATVSSARGIWDWWPWAAAKHAFTPSTADEERLAAEPGPRGISA